MSLAWQIEFTRRALKQIKKIDKAWQTKIIRYLKKVVDKEEVYKHGKLLAGNKKGIWRYRVGDYRVLCEIKDDKMIILVLSVGHRSKVYID